MGTIAIRRGDFQRANQLLTESLHLYRAVESKFDIAGSLAQQGFLALRQIEPARALDLFRQSLPLYRNYPTSPWVTRDLAQLLIAYAACENWNVAARLAGALGVTRNVGAGRSLAPPELSGRVKQAYEEAVVRTGAALGLSAFGEEIDVGSLMIREEAIDFALRG